MKKLLFIFIFCQVSLSLKGQALNAFMLQFHGPGCDNQSGKLAVQATGGTGTYTYLWSNGSTIDTAYNLGAGSHWVTVYSGGDSIVKYQTLDPWGIDTVHIINACNGGLGNIFLDNINAQYPIQFLWFNNNGLMTQSTAQISNLPAGVYSYKIIDAEGCTDSAQVEIVASTPELNAYVSDSTLCYGQSAQIWYTPGFTLYDNWGITYNSNTDTITAQNYMNLISFPTYGVDSFGCEASLANNAFVYLQPHPDPVPLYQIGDTISVSFIINPNPSSTLIYTWSIGATQISVGPYSYLPIDSSGNYSVSILNQYGCTNFGSLQAFITGLSPDIMDNSIKIANNPATDQQYWQIEVKNFKHKIDYSLYDLQGKLMLKSQSLTNVFNIPPPANSGIYFLEFEGKSYKLVKH
jgi:hypothetical protein